uniref:Myosin light chain alkali n=1 Tax=Clastoptera arizonana TaxID=38151 RepID=A0A1B6D242_9HEMI
MADLNSRDLAKADVVFSIYEDGKGNMDAFYLTDAIRANHINPTLKGLEKFEIPKRKGQKNIRQEEFFAIVSQAKKEKEGNYEDFHELLKQYDKYGTGKMMVAELSHILRALGEKLTDKEAEDILKDCMEQEDEDGFTRYDPFIKAFMAKVVI